MRPHRLEVTAFGAFAGTVEICFRDLAQAGLFLLHGETGAGKTTLLDAIGFALYGRVPGVRAQARRLRSDHADDGVRTQVLLEVTISGRLLRVTRSPEQTRQKLRGTGTTTEQAKVLLEEHAGGSWRVLSSRVGEADAEITELMGMSADQFFQVVLLPQGEFARFLQAGSAERGKLLERLFGTEQFRAVEEWLADRRRRTAHQVDDARGEVATLAARIAQAAAVAEPGQQLLGSAAGLSAWATALAAQAAATAAVTMHDAVACKAGLDLALGRRSAALRLADRQQRRATAHRRYAELVEAAPGVERVRRELDAATRAAEVAAALNQADAAGQRLTQARAAEESARFSAAPAGAAHLAGIDALRAAASARREQVGRLEGLRELATRAAAEDGAAARATERAAALTGRLAACADAIGRLEGRRSDTAAWRDEARGAAQRLPDARADAQRLREVATHAIELADTSAEQRRMRRDHAHARETAIGLREDAQRIREARFEGMISELAAGLVAGTPCPVCGALDHPDPSEVRADRVTYEQEQRATTEAERAQDRVAEIGRKLAAASALAADLTARLARARFASADPGGPAVPDPAGCDPDVLHALASARERDVAALTKLAAALPGHDRALEELGDALRETEDRRAALVGQQRSALDEASAARRRADEYRNSLLAQLNDAPDLDTALAAVSNAAASLTAAADAALAARAAALEAERAAKEAEQAARRAGFASASLARAAARQADWRADAQAKVDKHREDMAAAQHVLADPDLDVLPDPPADVAMAEAALRTARDAHERAVADHDRAQHRSGQLGDLAPRLTAKLTALEPLAARADQVRRLAELTAGQGANTLRMTLSSFVLAARLEEVAAAASERLLLMTAGRYCLVHTDTGRGGARAGLGLLARDAWTGRDRDTNTLSGGEMFLASLALALGLSDVVTAEAGGGRMEALFVDEGFGSLDEETLDEVMTVLDGLREGGRIVGVVSHVTELRQRIPAQIQVTKGRTGSHVRIVAT
jgi:exonuclease SbcC